MSAKNKILEILEQYRGTDISGQHLAQSLNISRSAVHKAINELRLEGFYISAVTNKGYRLSEQSDVISSEGIKIFLHENTPVKNIFVYESLPSTNQTAKQMALDGAGSGTIVIADGQTSGRGRMGRSFFSPPGSGIYMSVILRPGIKIEKGALITTSTSVAVCKAIEKYLGIYPKIKWVNDILLNGKKICGISTEALTGFEIGNIEHVVLGIGINIKTRQFPPELEDTAGCLLPEGENGVIRNRLIAEILNEIFVMLPDIETGYFINEYRKRLIVLGKRIKIIKNNETVQYAKAIDIDDLGRLVVELEDGAMQLLSSEEISILF